VQRMKEGEYWASGVEREVLRERVEELFDGSEGKRWMLPVASKIHREGLKPVRRGGCGSG
jgi:hypothetical protein